MLVDRALIMRALNIVAVSGIDSIVISQDGSVCHPSPDRTVIVYGNTKVGTLDADWALPDISLFTRMLKAFSSPSIDIVRQKNSFNMVGDGIQWRYRLGNKESLQVLQPDIVQEVVDSIKHTVTVTIDAMKKIVSIQSTVRAAYIHFIAKEGHFKVQVGEAETYSGVIDLEAAFDTEFDVKIPADKFTEIVEKLDAPSIVLGFALEGRKAIRVSLPEFSWVLGAVKEGEK